MKSPLLCLATLLVAGCCAPAPSQGQETTSSLSRPILAGPFTLEMRLALGTIGGTASSIWLGEQINIGLDSRVGTWFVEGPHLKQTRLLQKHQLRADEAFDLRITRDAADQLVVHAKGQLIYQTKLPGDVGLLRLRPHRGRIDVHSQQITGNLGPAPAPIELRLHNIPLTHDGQLGKLAELAIDITTACSLTQLQLSGHQLELLAAAELQIGSARHAATIRGGTLTLTKPVALSPGRVQLALHLGVRPDIALTARFELSGLQARFADGRTQDITVIPLRYRLAANLHRQGENDCHTFRIPGIARANDGTLLAVYDMRYTSRRDLQGHMDIGLSRSTDGGQSWTAPEPILDMGEHGGKPQAENGVSDPNILVDPATGEIIVTALWTWGRPGTHQWRGKGSAPGFGPEVTTQFMAVRSSDHGRSWSKPENWTRALKQEAWYLFAPAPGNGIVLRDGTLVIPTQGRDENGLPFSNITWSKDHGQTWTVSAPARNNTTECAVAELSDGRLMLNMRDNRNRSFKDERNGRAVSVTADLGKTWTLHSSDHGALSEPVCMASLLHHDLADGRRVLLFSNPNSRQHRKNMTLRLSTDDGMTWPSTQQQVLDIHGGAYSSLVMIDPETVGILYESSQADLVFQAIPLAELLPGK